MSVVVVALMGGGVPTANRNEVMWAIFSLLFVELIVRVPVQLSLMSFAVFSCKSMPLRYCAL